MYIIMVYDVNVKRVNKVLKKSRQYLTWIQNSVFEGELTEAQYKVFKMELKKIINLETDSVIFFKFRVKTKNSKEILGVEKNSDDIFL